MIHCAFDHDFSRFGENCEKDRRNIEAIGAALAGSPRPFVITSSTGMGSLGGGQLAREDVFDHAHRTPRKITEETGNAVLARGVNVSYVRLPQVHDTKKQGLISPLIEVTRAKGRVAYVGEGHNRWPAAHLDDVARLYKLAVERGQAGARYHAVAEEGITMRAIAEALGRRLELPVVSLTGDEAAAHFGWLAMFAGVDMAASSAITRRKLGWEPVGPGLIADLENCEV